MRMYPALAADDFILIGMNTVRQVESVTTTDGDTMVTVDKAFSAMECQVRRSTASMIP